MNILKSTSNHEEYWRNRKIDWHAAYTSTWDHPHRQMIVDFLRNKIWTSVLEIGCGPGPNLVRIFKEFPHCEVGGVDINPDAIAAAQQIFPQFKKYFECRPIDDLMVSTAGVDIVLTDMALIYIGRDQIHKVLEEIKRVARRYVIFVEFHSESWLGRMKLKARTGYNAHDYKKLLSQHGFYDIIIEKIPDLLWPEDYRKPRSQWVGNEPQKTYAYIITAKV